MTFGACHPPQTFSVQQVSVRHARLGHVTMRREYQSGRDWTGLAKVTHK